jgi:SAM-dependent methyltransferase
LKHILTIGRRGKYQGDSGDFVLMIRYQSVDDFPGWEKAPAFLKSVIEKYGSRSILEVGSGANPSLEPDYVRAQALNYVTSDLEESELAKAAPEYARLVLNLCSKIDPNLHGSFDCVFSRMVGEHIRDGAKFHGNIFNVLRPGGISLHFFSCLGTLPFFLNRCLPDRVTDGLLRFFNPRDEVKHGKFKAYYSWAWGPSRTMIGRFHSVGFEIVEYVGYFGHGYYGRRMKLVQDLENFKTRQLMRSPVPQLCSYATLILQKPE